MNIEKLPIHRDKRGELIPVYFSNLPFIPQRIFYIIGVPKGTERGGHGHYKCQQYYICIKGIIEVKIYDVNQKENIILTPGKALFIDKMIWTSEKFITGNEVLLVLCSHEYDANDYFTDINSTKSL